MGSNILRIEYGVCCSVAKYIDFVCGLWAAEMI